MPPRNKNLPDAPVTTTSGQKTPTKRSFVEYYLIVYNVLSTLGWAYVLISTAIHLLTYSPAPPHHSISTVDRLLSYLKPRNPAPHQSKFSNYFTPLLARAKQTYGAHYIGPATALVQSLAVLEVSHSVIGWVRSPVQTVVMQVLSRLFLVWGIVYQNESARTSPFYASMLLAWSMTEVIRYSFYAASLVGYSSPTLTYLRYTTFWVLYPIGACSECLVAISTLPLASLSSHSPTAVFQWISKTWILTDYVKGLILLIYPPAFYMLYTHMIKQRSKVLGSAQKLKVR